MKINQSINSTQEEVCSLKIQAVNINVKLGQLSGSIEVVLRLPPGGGKSQNLLNLLMH